MSQDPDAPQDGSLPPEIVNNGPEPAPIAVPPSQLDQDIDEQNLDAAILAHPEWGSVSMLANAASFDIVVPDVVAKAHSNQFWNVERNGLFSISNGGGSLLETFEQMFGIADDNGKKKDDEDNLSAFSDAVHDQREEARRQQDIEATRSEAEIDAMPWVGDSDSIWTMGDVSASRKQWLSGAKAARKKIDEDDSLSDAEKIRLKRQLSDIEVAIKENRPDDAARIKKDLPPEYQKAMDREALQQSASIKADVAPDLSRAATSKASGTEKSTTARSSILDEDTATTSALSKPATATATPSELTTKTDIKLSGTFTDLASRVTPDAGIALASAAPPTSKLDFKMDI